MRSYKETEHARQITFDGSRSTAYPLILRREGKMRTLIKSETYEKRATTVKTRRPRLVIQSQGGRSPNIHLSQTTRLRLVIFFDNVGSKQSRRWKHQSDTNGIQRYNKYTTSKILNVCQLTAAKFF